MVVGIPPEKKLLEMSMRSKAGRVKRSVGMAPLKLLSPVEHEQRESEIKFASLPFRLMRNYTKEE